ncbi:hypothetical protein HPB47_011769 [Ixodes persulcatus]|uniref:Uncharacterized protein n=1 Tax=Ixodes persulcatus TaxID=34615 RepID=A0AC60NVH3_IXOPE|nr:hypothetical protein HPB47_011769 [Ixodes persulcatus]
MGLSPRGLAAKGQSIGDERVVDWLSRPFVPRSGRGACQDRLRGYRSPGATAEERGSLETPPLEKGRPAVPLCTRLPREIKARACTFSTSATEWRQLSS